MRVFAAVFPPPDVQRALIEAAGDQPNFRPTASHRIHLTLKFLGEIPRDALPGIIAALEPLRDAQQPFDTVTSNFGAFPSTHRARILWAGLGEGADQLRALAETVGTLLEPEGFAREDKTFIPHLTLGRARRPTPFDAGTDLPKLRFTVSGVDLVQSKHGAAGVAYSTLARYEFQRTRHPGSCG